MSSNFDSMRYDPSRDADFWSDAPHAPASGSLPAKAARGNGGGGRGGDPLDKLRRLLRGRTTLAVVLALVGALFGAALGWMSQKPVYQASGSALIPPAVPSITGGEFGNPNYKGFMATEADFAESEQMALAAMDEPAWIKVVDKPWPPTNFAGAANAMHTGNDSLMRFSFKSSDPKVARAGVVALMDAYKTHFLEQRTRTGNMRVREIAPQVKELRDQADENDAKIEAAAAPYGTTDLTQTRDNLIRSRSDVATRLRDIDLNLQAATEARDAALKNPESVTEEMMADYSDDMRSLLDARGKIGAQIQALDVRYGQNHPLYRNAQGQAVINTLNIDDLAKRLRGQFYGFIPVLNSIYGGPTRQPVDNAYLAQLQGRQQVATGDLARLDGQITAIQQAGVTLEPLLNKRNEIYNQREKLTGIANSETQNSAFQEALGTIQLYPPSAAAVSVAKDKRAAMALGGAILGFGIPVGLVLLLGTVDKRFRYSDDAGDAAGRAPLLGILPNLPDRLSDPNQASIAAHCVHQIRTMLQINHGSDEPRAFAVTSAQRGDGKTSLALALGLSYAASGARTLLVDTDLQSGGLSNRLGVGGDEGVMDALSGGDLLKYVCETDVTDLAILPIGRGVANHAGAFSPGAVRHLIEQAKRRYDVIVCDTGPVLGSIESTPIVAAVDGALLVVSRGQSRPLVDKALTHLETVGATISGMVFNRAQAADFEKSVSGMNLKGGSAAGRLAGKNGQAKGSKPAKGAGKLVKAS